MRTKTLTQKEVYQDIKNAMVTAGFDKSNTSVITLQLPLNDFSTKEQLMVKINKFRKVINADSIVVIEPVMEEDGFNPFRPDYYRNRYFQNSEKFLPIYHAHLVIKLPPEIMLTYRDKWLKIIKSKKACLYHCDPIKKDIPHLVNYITKYFELKRDAEPVYEICLQEELMPAKSIMRTAIEIIGDYSVRETHRSSSVFDVIMDRVMYVFYLPKIAIVRYLGFLDKMSQDAVSKMDLD